MKILLVAPQSRDTVLGTIGGHCKEALINLGYNVETFDFRQSQYLKSPIGSLFKKSVKKFFPFSPRQIPFIDTIEREKMNRSLLATTKEYRPDILFVLMGDTIFPKTLKKIKKLGIIIVNWFLDTVIDPRCQRISLVEHISPYCDYFFIIDSQDVLNYIDIGAPCVRSIPLACCPTIHKSIIMTPNEKKKYSSEVCFVGSINYRREKILKSLTDFDLGIWGNWEKEDPLLYRFYRKKHVYLEEAVKIYNASEITLDIHFFGTEKRAFNINPRVFEATGSGAFVLTNKNPYLADLYEIDKEIACYRDEEDLKEKIKYYLEHPEGRKRIAQRGQQRAHRNHTYEKRLKEIFSIIKKNG